LDGDWDTISGVVFDHKGETPGLGAEITTPKFRDQFVGKRIFDGSELVGITVLKGAGSSRGNDHAVDAISGGTITSRAVETMIRATLAEYKPYIEKQRSNGSVE
jgi:Na+-transporting NADH:ubiquinone oxidoreductase subunit C